MGALEASSYQGQQKTVLQLFGASSLLATSGGGTINQAIQVANTLITAFSSRFSNTFDEYRILGCTFKVQSVSAPGGLTAFWYDEKSTSAPTLNNAQERTIMSVLPNNDANARSYGTFTWKAKDLLDLQYTSVATSVTPVTFKVYTDTANYASPASTNIWFIQPVLTVEFRGIASN